MVHTTRLSAADAARGLAPARAVSSSNIALSGLQTIDSVVLAAGDRILVTNQDNPAENGVYIVGAGLWSRAPDFNTPAEMVEGRVVNVTEGVLAGIYTWTLDETTGTYVFTLPDDRVYDIFTI